MNEGGACHGCGPTEDWTSPMTGNSTHRFRNTAVLAVQTADASRVVSSDALDDALADTYRRVGLRPGLLERLAGIRERRWWADGVTFVDGAAMAGAKAISESGVDPAGIGLMINTSVSRRYLEPSTAVAVHHALGLPRSAQNFDVTNACLGFVNGMELAAAMIDSGMVDHALIVNGEDSRIVQERTIERLQGPGVTSRDVISQFATLTLGSGAAAMVLGRADRHPEGHRVVGGVSRAGTQHHELCVGDMSGMRTDSRRLFEAGLALAVETWKDAAEDFDWATSDRFVAHQTSVKHIAALAKVLGMDRSRFPMTLPTFGNMGPAAVPFTLATQLDTLQAQDKVLLLGIGSGLNTSFAEITW
jgi:3-oxoacyl-[acyl-carrier-protein] synthase-3